MGRTGQHLARWMALPLLLSGCSYITQKTFEEKKDNLDQDLDESPFGEDCDDLDPAMTPGADEIPYDGVDNDCGRDGDQVDIDGDGFAGISKADYDALQPPPKEAYPTRFVNKPLDCVDDPRVHPAAGSIHPDLDPDPTVNGEDGEIPNTDEVEYDGIDTNCDGSNDFDADGDGYMPDEVVFGGVTIDVATAYAAYMAEWNYQDREADWGAPAGAGAPLQGDCEDSDPQVHPGSPLEDVPYDGIDQQCTGTNDFDLDGDGWMPATLPDGSPTDIAYNQFVAEVHGGSPPWQLPADVVGYDGTVLTAFDDCLDDDDPGIVDPVTGLVVAAATVFPQIPGIDVAYDSIDSDCNRDNDFDADNDAFMPDSVPAGAVPTLYDAYVAAWGYEALEASWGDINPVLTLVEPGYGDCDDNSAITYPAALESLSDPNDQDCDGDPDGTPFAFAGYSWGTPSRPAVDRVGDFYVISVTSQYADINGPLDHVGVSMMFHLDEATSMAEPSSTPLQWKANNPMLPVGDQVDMVVDRTVTDIDGDGELDPGFWVSTTYTAANNYTYLMAAPVYWNSPTQKFLLTGSTVYNWIVSPGYIPTDIEIELDDLDGPFILACSPDTAHVVRGAGAPPTLAASDATTGLGGVCFLDGPPYFQSQADRIDFTRCSSVACLTQTIDDAVASLQITTGPPTGELWDAGRYRDGVQALRDSAGLVVRDVIGGTQYTAFSGMAVTAHDGTVYDGEVYAVAVVDDLGTPRVFLEYGTPGNTTLVLLPFQHDTLPDLEPVDVGLHVDADRIAVSVMGRDRFGNTNLDSVGWIFLGH